jgi:hypothetical protein
MAIIKFNEEHLGSSAGREDAEKMIRLLQDRGYDVAYGDSGTADEIPTDVWEECLDAFETFNFYGGGQSGHIEGERLTFAEAEKKAQELAELWKTDVRVQDEQGDAKGRYYVDEQYFKWDR